MLRGRSFSRQKYEPSQIFVEEEVVSCKLLDKVKLAAFLLSIISPNVANASCCAHPRFVEYKKEESKFIASCIETFRLKHPAEMLLLDGIEIYRFSDGITLVSHSSLGCFGPLELERDLSLMSRFSAERNEWVGYLFSNQEPHTSIAFSDTMLNITIE